jgi:predicted small lipoprotein YifL
MRNIFVILIASLVAISVAGCAGKGKVPVGKGKAPIVHTKG